MSDRISINPETPTRLNSLLVLLEEKIRDESRMLQDRVQGDYYQGRVDAFSFVYNELKSITVDIREGLS